MPGKEKTMIEEEIWAEIPNFPDYSVSSFGRVMNTDFRKVKVLSVNPVGDLIVGMMGPGPSGRTKQYCRSVKVLVARAFVEGENEIDNTPILLDGNRTNLHYTNIAWRPRWLAIEYMKQFNTPQKWWDHGPIEDRAGNRYESIIVASMTIGSTARRIMYSIRDVDGYRRVIPGGETFRFVK